MKKNYQYYEKLWESLPLAPRRNPDWERVVGLLLDYTKAYGISNVVIFFGLHFSFLGRLFTGHWNRHHVNLVKEVINPFYSDYQFIDGDEEHHYYETSNIIGLLKNNIFEKNKYIKPFGDLSLILEVIKNKTGVDYDLIPPVTKESLGQI